MLALQALCVYEKVREAFDAQVGTFLADAEVLADLGIESPAPAEVTRFAYELVRGAWSDLSAIDELLEKSSTHWRVARMTPVDRNVLRLGVHELRAFPQTAAEVVINEAVELARQFGDTDSPAFVNGVLDAVYRAMPPRGDGAAGGESGRSDELAAGESPGAES